MEPARIIVAMSNDASISKLRTVLSENGYTIVDHAKDGNDCLRKARTLRPDIVIVDCNLPVMSGYDVAKVLCEDRVSDVIVIAAGVQEGFISDEKCQSSIVCMVKPISKPNLVSTIDLMMKTKRRINELEKEIDELRQNLDTRKEVEKAKGLLMKHHGLNESEAFKRIQRQSMDRGIAMKDIAKAIILAYDI